MSAAQGPGQVPVDVDDLPDGWEAFATCDPDAYYCFPSVYYYCRSRDVVQWEKPKESDAVDEPYSGETISGRKPYEKGDELIPDPPAPKPYDGPLSDKNYVCSCEDPADLFPPDEEMLEACLDCDMKRLKKALTDGSDVSLPNHPWQNTPLHLANAPFFWDADSLGREKELRFEMTQFLVKAGADMDAENIFHCKPIDFAIFSGYQETVAFLNSQGCQSGWFGAAFNGELQRIKELLEEGQDIDLQGRYQRTAFAEAHMRGRWVLQTFLAQQGCSREMPHPEFMKFNPGGAAIPRGNLVPSREIQYWREDDPEWFDDMMEKRFPGYKEKMAHLPKGE